MSVIVERTLTIAATCPRVFAALTEIPELLRWYEFAQATQIEPWVGGRYDMSNQGQMVISGEVLEIDPPHLLRHSFRFLNPRLDQSVSAVTWQLRDTPQGCRLQMVHNGLDLSLGWDQLLPRLKATCEDIAPRPAQD